MDIVKFWDNNFKTEKYDDTLKINDFCPNINFFNRLSCNDKAKWYIALSYI